MAGYQINMDGYQSPRDEYLSSPDGSTGGDHFKSPLTGGKYQKTYNSVSSGDDTHFHGGHKIIDYVLVHEERTILSDAPTPLEKKHRSYRENFLRNLHKGGLETEEEVVQLEKTMLYFTKIHAPWDVLTMFAEELCVRSPLQVSDSHASGSSSSNFSAKVISKLHCYNIMNQHVPNPPTEYYSAHFRRSKMDKYIGIENQETFFKPRERSRIVYEILATASYGKRKKAEIGVDRMLEEKMFVGAFPLHEGPYEPPSSIPDPTQLNRRQVLYKYWASWGKWYKYQPLDHIRDYFGEKIGIYFAWLGFYTAWLLPASIVGILVFSYGIITMFTNIPAIEACDPNNNFTMCPQCDENAGCETWPLSDKCFFIKISYLFDHPGTVFYAIFMSFWAVTFLEYWKRKNVSLAHHWECLNFEDEEERPRPEYAAMAPHFEKNPITGVTEPFFPPRERLPRILSGIAVIIIMISLALIFIVAVIMYRVLITIPLFKNKSTRSQSSTIASMSAAVINLILIMALGKVYEKLAFKMTQWEMHRTQTEFEDQLTFKVFLFQFVNFYSSIFYIAFFKGKFVGYPGHYRHMFGLRNEECSNGGCLIELAQQLGVIMVGKQIINNMQELLVPKLKTFYRKYVQKQTKGLDLKTRWEQDFDLLDFGGLFEEYLEMVLQFGFITIFVAAFPIAPVFALLNNWVEIRLDSQKLVCDTRRPVAERCEDIGVWFTILDAIANMAVISNRLEIRLDSQKLVCDTRRPVAERCEDIGVWFTILDAIANMAVISNAFLIAFTSEFLPKMLYQYQHNVDLVGFTNFTLAYSPPGSMKHECRYLGWRDRNGHYTPFYWSLLTARLAFIIVFEHVVFGINRLIDVIVPDVPEALETKIKRERYLAKQALADTDNMTYSN